MAALELQGGNVNVYFRDNGTTQAWQKLTCEQNLTFTLANNVTTDLTKCGPFKGVLIPPDAKFTGSAVANINPVVTGVNQELSYDHIQADQNVGQKKDFRIQNNAFGSTGLSDVLLIAGSGYFTETVMTANNGETVKFTYTFEVVGTVEIHES